MSTYDEYETGVNFVRRLKNLPQAKHHIPPNQCNYPWNSLNLDKHGRVYVCRCEGWLPFPSGHILDFDSFDEIFNSPVTVQIKDTINKGTYDYCDVRHCNVSEPWATTEENNKGIYITFGIDESCNLQCGSCRKEMIFHNDDEFFNERLKWIEKLHQWIQLEKNKKVTIMIGGNGEVFASRLYLKFMESKFDSNINYMIRSNGLLLKRHIENLKLLPNLRKIEISIDAASKKVYEIVRKPGNWDQLQESLAHLLELRETYKFEVAFNFVIQKENLEDVVPFYYFCKEKNVEPCFTQLENWSSFDNFDEQCVHRPEDKLFSRFIEILNSREIKSLNLSWAPFYSEYLSN